MTYFYRDGANYKQWDEVVVKGQIDLNDLQTSLWEGEFFIPQAVGLPPLQERFAEHGYEFPNEDDHAWHKIGNLEETDDAPTWIISAAQLTKRFHQVSHYGWMNWLAAES